MLRRCLNRRQRPTKKVISPPAMRPRNTPNPRPPDDSSIVQEHRSWLQLQIVLFICRFTPTCPEVVRILSLGMDRELPLRTRIKLRVHYQMCSFCEHYAKQLKYMRAVAREFPEKIGEADDATLPAEIKERMKQQLRFVAVFSPNESLS